MSTMTKTLPIYIGRVVETEKAIRVSVNFSEDGGNLCLSSFYPKKEVNIDRENNTITMPLWLYKEKKP